MLIPNIIAVAAVAATFVSGLPTVTDANYAVLAAREAVPAWSTQAHTVSKRGFGVGGKSKRQSSPPRQSNPKPDDLTRRPLTSPSRQRRASPPVPAGETLEKRMKFGGLGKIFGKKKKPSSPPAAQSIPERPAYPAAPPPRADGNPFPTYHNRPHSMQVPPKPYEPNFNAPRPGSPSPRPGEFGNPLPYGAKPSIGKRDVADESLEKRQGIYAALRSGPRRPASHSAPAPATQARNRDSFMDIYDQMRANPAAFKKSAPKKTTQKRDVEDADVESDYESDQEDYEDDLESDDEDNVIV
ncbi:hypothetical protein HYALB_00011364 [Hymenoscyphus albidus]|uniref:Uncharacterized protein n=1 Tax=Hymenoscyphus albidus TaxID=595503 RepID=A0A9N9LRZ4_9HELO|nr:hypothetical protein HYALB_00011364 [Hymenoscyphus albidus]